MLELARYFFNQELNTQTKVAGETLEFCNWRKAKQLKQFLIKGLKTEKLQKVFLIAKLILVLLDLNYIIYIVLTTIFIYYRNAVGWSYIISAGIIKFPKRKLMLHNLPTIFYQNKFLWNGYHRIWKRSTYPRITWIVFIG